MAAIDYIKLEPDLYFGDKTGKNFKQVPRCERATWTSTTTQKRMR